MDQVQDGHAAQKVRQLHAPIQMQDKYGVSWLGLPILSASNFQVPKQRTYDIVADGVEEVENADESACYLRDLDEARRATVAATLLDLVVLAQAVEAPEEADEDNQDGHLVDNLGGDQADIDDDLLAANLVLQHRVLIQEVKSPEEGTVAQRVDQDNDILVLGQLESQARLESRHLLGDDGHFAVDAEHAADEEAIDDDYDDVLLGEKSVC